VLQYIFLSALSCFFFTGYLPLNFSPIFDKVNISPNPAAMGILGSVWTVSDFNFSGLSNDTLKNVYVRKACVDMWHKLEALETNNILFLDGAPGVGKSTELFGWSLYKAKTKVVWWLHGDVGQTTMINLQTGDCCLFPSNCYVNNISDSILHAVQPNSIVVLDGFTDAFQNIFRRILSIKEYIIIGCTSFSADKGFNTSDYAEMQSVYGKVLVRFTMDSWLFEEYCQILNKTDIFQNTINNGEELGERYFYAGGSIRLLIDFSQNDTMSMLNRSFEKVQNYSTFFNGITGSYSKDSVNTVMQRHNGKTTPLSNYIVRRLVEKVDMAFIEMAKNFLTQNEPYQGWIFELEIMIRLKNNLLIDLNVSPDWKYGKDASYFYFHDVNDINPDTLRNDTWLIPFKYNFGCIDMMYYHSRGNVDPVQVTSAKNHVYKLHIITPIIKILADNDKCKVTFYVIIPLKNANNCFKITCTHFRDIELIALFDDRWKSPDNVDKFCNVLFMKGNTVIANTAKSKSIGNVSTDIDINTSSSDSTHSIQHLLHKKRRVDIDFTDFHNQEEDNTDVNNI
jgi:hypothetical protein